MALHQVLRGLINQGGALLGQGLVQWQAAAGCGASAVLQKRAASSHAENTNTFLREVRVGLHHAAQPVSYTAFSRQSSSAVTAQHGQYLWPAQHTSRNKPFQTNEIVQWPAIDVNTHVTASHRREIDTHSTSRRTSCNPGYGKDSSSICAAMQALHLHLSCISPSTAFCLTLMSVHTCLHVLQALYQLEYPDRLQKLLLTPNREMGVELVVQVRHRAYVCSMQGRGCHILL